MKSHEKHEKAVKNIKYDYDNDNGNENENEGQGKSQAFSCFFLTNSVIFCGFYKSITKFYMVLLGFTIVSHFLSKVSKSYMA